LISIGTDNTLGYPTVIKCAEWTTYAKNRFDWFTRQKYLDHKSPSTPSSKHPTKKFTPPYGLTFARYSDDVGVVDKLGWGCGQEDKNMYNQRKSHE
jgi:hypothetical protein